MQNATALSQQFHFASEFNKIHLSSISFILSYQDALLVPQESGKSIDFLSLANLTKNNHKTCPGTYIY